MLSMPDKFKVNLLQVRKITTFKSQQTKKIYKIFRNVYKKKNIKNFVLTRENLFGKCMYYWFQNSNRYRNNLSKIAK